MPNQEPAFAWPFGNGPVRVGTQGLFRLCLTTFVAPFLPALLTAPGSPRMPQNLAWKVNSHFFSRLYRDYSNSLTLSNASDLLWSWISINHIQVHKEKENFVIACLRLSQNVKSGILMWQSCSDGKETYKKAWCTCKVVVLPYQAIVFFTFSSPLHLRARLHGGGAPQVGEGTRLGGVTRLSK